MKPKPTAILIAAVACLLPTLGQAQFVNSTNPEMFGNILVGSTSLTSGATTYYDHPRISFSSTSNTPFNPSEPEPLAMDFSLSEVVEDLGGSNFEHLVVGDFSLSGKPLGRWSWNLPNPNNTETAYPAMILERNSILRLQNPYGTTQNPIVLNPNNGTILIGQYPVLTTATGLTVAAGDARYVRADLVQVHFNSSLSVGTGSNASGSNSIAVGASSLTSGINSAAFGDKAKATGSNSLASGSEAEATASNTIALGEKSKASGVSSLAVGPYTISGGNYSTAIGHNVSSAGAYSVAMGFQSSVHSSATHGIAFGTGATVTASEGTAIGRRAYAYAPHAMALGSFVEAKGTGQVALGTGIHVTGDAVNFNNQDSEVFVVGGGVYQGWNTPRHNGANVLAKNVLTVKRSGDATIRGGLWVRAIDPSGLDSISSTTTNNGWAPWSPDVSKVEEVAAATALAQPPPPPGTTQFDGPVIIKHLVPQGDISMGPFTSGGTP